MRSTQMPSRSLRTGRNQKTLSYWPTTDKESLSSGLTFQKPFNMHPSKDMITFQTDLRSTFQGMIETPESRCTVMSPKYSNKEEMQCGASSERGLEKKKRLWI